MVALTENDNVDPELDAKSPADTVQTPPSQAGGFRNGVGNAINSLMGRQRQEDETVKDKAKNNVKEEAKDVAKKEVQQVAKTAVRRAATQVAAWGARAIAAATSEVWLPIVLILLAIGAVIVIIAIVVSIAQSGKLGSSFHIDASANTQLTALANAGDVFARRTLDASDIPAVSKALDSARPKAQTKNDTESVSAIDALKARLATFSSSDSKVDQQVLIDAATLLKTLSSKGYGTAAYIPADKGVCPDTLCIQMGMAVTSKMNPHYDIPKVIIVHYWGEPTTSPDDAKKYLESTLADNDPSNNRYVQFFISHAGKIYQFLPESKQASGALNYNAVPGGISISIENEGNFESDNHAAQATTEQLQADVQLIKYLTNKYHIAKSDVISHKLADQRAGNTSGRRSDPGDKFMSDLLSKI